MTSYLATFDRIGRNHVVPPLNVAGDAQDIAEQIYRYAKPRLASRDVEVLIDLDKMEGAIVVGLVHCAGRIGLTCTNQIVTE